MSDWTNIHKPKNWEEVLGSKMNMDIVQNFFWAWGEGHPISNAIMLAGDEGCGKTTIAEVAAKMHNFTLIHVNASEIRDAKSYNDLKLIAGFESWDNEMKCILIDECDGLGRRMDGRWGGKGNKDATAWQAIMTMIEAGKTPIILCCNYASNTPWKIRSNKNVTTLEMKNTSIPRQQLFNRLMQIATVEGYEPNVEGVKRIAKVCPTVRSAIKTLQLCCVNDNWKAIYPRDIDGSEDMQYLKLFRGETDVLPNRDTYKMQRIALANRIPLSQLTKYNMLCMMRRKVGGFHLHEAFATTMQNTELKELVQPQFNVSKSLKAKEKERAKKEEQKRASFAKKVAKQKASPPKPKKKAPEPIPQQAQWDDLF